MDPNPLPDVDPDAYVDAEAEVADMLAGHYVPRSLTGDSTPHRAEVEHIPTLPDVGEEVWHQGRAFTVEFTNVTTKHLTGDRWKLDVHITAWIGEPPFDEPIPFL